MLETCFYKFEIESMQAMQRVLPSAEVLNYSDDNHVSIHRGQRFLDFVEKLAGGPLRTFACRKRVQSSIG